MNTKCYIIVSCFLVYRLILFTSVGFVLWSHRPPSMSNIDSLSESEPLVPPKPWFSFILRLVADVGLAAAAKRLNRA